MLNQLREVIFLAYDAGRITGGRARELLGLQYLIDFRGAYQEWQEQRAARHRPARNEGHAKTLALIRLQETAEALAAATDNGEEMVTPDPQLVENVVRAALAVDAGAVQKGLREGRRDRRLSAREFNEAHLKPLALAADAHGLLLAAVVVELEEEEDSVRVAAVASSVQYGETGSGESILKDVLGEWRVGER